MKYLMIFSMLLSFNVYANDGQLGEDVNGANPNEECPIHINDATVNKSNGNANDTKDVKANAGEN